LIDLNPGYLLTGTSHGRVRARNRRPSGWGETKPRLKERQRLFVEEYLVDLSAAEAARRAGYSEWYAARIGYQLLQKRQVQDAIAAAMRERSARTGVAADKVVQGLARVAFSNICDVVSWKDNEITLKPSSELEHGEVGGVAEVSQTDSGTLKVKMHDKLRALEALSKHLGLYAQSSPESPDLA
jgi:phage terminase small subunit